MTACPGDTIRESNGVTLKCQAPSPPCIPWENVEGHGATAKEAWEAAQEKYKLNYDAG